MDKKQDENIIRPEQPETAADIMPPVPQTAEMTEIEETA